MIDNRTDELSIRLQELTYEFESRLDSKLQEISLLWSAWEKSHDKDFAELSELHRLVHNLSGSSATFGFHEVSRCAHEIDEKLGLLLDHASVETQGAVIGPLLESLGVLVGKCGSKTNDGLRPEKRNSVSRLVDDDVIVLVLEDDDVYAREIEYHLSYFGYTVRLCQNIQEADSIIGEIMPDIIMFDIILPGDDLGGINSYLELRSKFGDLPPTFFFSMRDDLEARLEAVRAGASGYFVKPLDYGEVVDQLEYVLTRKNEDQYRIMIIDDDIDIAKRTSLILEQSGAISRVIVDTRELLHSLSDFRPELILMDLNMPNASGVELAKIIRQQNAYIDTTIVFHSTETQVHKHMEAMRSGGDDFLIKPVPDDDLVTGLFTRLKRSRSINHLMIRDSLTNLINHSNVEDMLNRELMRSKRTGDILSYAMIDIDHFKLVNDRYGHLVGDNVLVTLSRFLKQKFRATDVVGRYGGEEFAVILPDTNIVTALKLFEDVRLEFSRIRHVGANQKFTVSLSIGLASCPPFTSVEAIQNAADNALYESKHKGRNQTSLAGMENEVKVGSTT
jgi:diguanylate cyclase (GGDEF)-like protein